MLQWLREQGLETPLFQHRAISAWPEVMGNNIERYTKKVEIRHDILYVQIKSSALRANLSMMRDEIRQRLNNHIGAQIIQEVRFC